MRLKERASWDWDNSTCGGRGKGIGTIQARMIPGLGFLINLSFIVSSPSVSKSHKEGSSSYTDEVIHSFFANQSSAPQPDYDDLKQVNDDDMEDMDLKWQVAMISMRIKKFHKRTGKKL
nr:ribonuclease H-like domain-containing protein [Tanacetum cinerariifolium]GFB18613.1 ribonuclease H-like domain-containing protein [Tanacetum cinerariifolium]GFB35563.1 ribonuclease H-like domain-containing protein [Tanacetum cinerariifolium]